MPDHDGKLQPSEFAGVLRARHGGNRGQQTKAPTRPIRSSANSIATTTASLPSKCSSNGSRTTAPAPAEGGKAPDAAVKAAGRHRPNRMAGDPAPGPSNGSTRTRTASSRSASSAALWEGLEGRQQAEEIFPRLDKEHQGGISLEVFKGWLEDYRKQPHGDAPSKEKSDKADKP